MPRGVYDHDEVKSEDETYRVWKRCDDEGNELGTFVEDKHPSPNGRRPQTVVVKLKRSWTRLATLSMLSGIVGAGIEALIRH